MQIKTDTRTVSGSPIPANRTMRNITTTEVPTVFHISGRPFAAVFIPLPKALNILTTVPHMYFTNICHENFISFHAYFSTMYIRVFFHQPPILNLDAEVRRKAVTAPAAANTIRTAG